MGARTPSYEAGRRDFATTVRADLQPEGRGAGRSGLSSQRHRQSFQLALRAELPSHVPPVMVGGDRAVRISTSAAEKQAQKSDDESLPEFDRSVAGRNDGEFTGEELNAPPTRDLLK